MPGTDECAVKCIEAEGSVGRMLYTYSVRAGVVGATSGQVGYTAVGWSWSAMSLSATFGGQLTNTRRQIWHRSYRVLDGLDRPAMGLRRFLKLSIPGLIPAASG